MHAGRLIARTVIGGLFVGHGVQKLFGWFDGPGREGTEQMMDNLEMRPAKHNALAASVAETAGGAMLAAGALTPLAGTALTATMATAIRKVHAQNGLWNQGGGYEYNLVLIGAVAALVEAGPGKPSVDEAIGLKAKGPRWAIASLVAGVAGSALAIEAGRRASAAQQSEDDGRTEYDLHGDEDEPAIAEPTVATA